jgi:hypothetical protein
MARQVSDEILNKTECLYSFQCLDEENIDICMVDRCLQGNTCFLKTLKQKNCIYQRSFGYSHMCLCPVRAELYRRYRI